MLPFTKGEFLEVFAAYNIAVWPAQLFAYALAIAILAALLKRDEIQQRLALALIGLMWLWTGISYHWMFFREINPAATAFGLLFVIEGAALTWLAIRKAGALHFRWRADAGGVLGAWLIAYAAIFYPLANLYLDEWPSVPSFGITPCPVTLFTLGFLLLAEPRPSFWVWLVPVSWALIGGTAAFLLGIPQDWVLLVSGPLAMLVVYGRRIPAPPLCNIDREGSSNEPPARPA